MARTSSFHSQSDSERPNWRAGAAIIGAFLFTALLAFAIGVRLTDILRNDVAPPLASSPLVPQNGVVAKTTRATNPEEILAVEEVDKVPTPAPESLDVDAFIAAGKQ